MDNTGEGGKGLMATCYLGKQFREAFDEAIGRTGWLHSHYVRMAVLERLSREGLVSEAVVEAELERIEFKKKHPHGNSKRAKAEVERANKEEPSARSRSERVRELRLRRRARHTT
jgi:hypothetical protein